MTNPWSILAAAFFATLVALPGCGKDSETKDEPVPADPPAVAAVPADGAAASAPPLAHNQQEITTHGYTALIASFNERDEKAMAAAFAPDATVALVDSGESATGPATIVANNVRFWTALPDARIAPEIILVNGDRVAALVLGHGTNTGSTTTPAGVLPATGAETGSLGIEFLQFDASGRVLKGRQFWDAGLLLEQMQGADGARPAQRSGANAPMVVLADKSDDPTVLATARATMEAYLKGDLKRAVAGIADDATMYYTQLPADLGDKKAIAAYWAAERKAFPDLQGTIVEAWSAGSYVAMQLHIEGTHKHALEPHLMKPQGKRISLNVGALVKLRGAAIQRMWFVVNGAALTAMAGGTHGKSARATDKK